MAEFDPPIRASLQDEDCDLCSDDDARFRAALDLTSLPELLDLAISEYGLRGYRASTPREEIVADIVGVDDYLHGRPSPDGEVPRGLQA
jgi:hypothetical protein